MRDSTFEKMMEDFEEREFTFSLDHESIDKCVNRISKHFGILTRKSSRGDLILYDSAAQELIKAAEDLRDLIRDQVEQDWKKPVISPGESYIGERHDG